MELLIAPNSVPLSGADIMPTVGLPQYATQGNPTSGVPATILPASHYNMVMSEIVNAVVAAGLAPSGTDWTQLLQAIRGLIGASTTWHMLTSSGTIIVPAGFTRAEFMAIGGGAGAANIAGNSVSNNISGGAGGGGGFVHGIYPVTAGNSLVGSIGAGGAAQASGGTTSVSLSGTTLFTAGGGAGASFSAAGNSAGGAGGIATGGTLGNFIGNQGQDGQAGSNFRQAASGGAGNFGMGSAKGSGASSSAPVGVGGNAPGAGGGGIYDANLTGTAFTGGPGAPGVIYYRYL